MKLAYRREGGGPLLVCHPGGPGFSGSSLTDLGGLADSFECLVVDPRGTGSSPAADTFSQEEYVADLEELRAELGLEQFDLLGHSHGGFVATQYAATHPDRVRRLVLVTTAPRFSRHNGCRRPTSSPTSSSVSRRSSCASSSRARTAWSTCSRS